MELRTSRAGSTVPSVWARQTARLLLLLATTRMCIQSRAGTISDFFFSFLRWSALQDAAFNDPGDGGKKKIWSETNVSEDFDMALRLQLKGYTIRWATYSEGGFKEGVSLTVDDELNRWQKYSYGMLFPSVEASFVLTR